MFIERSAGRIRLARVVFVVVGLLPCLLLAGWAVHRGSLRHRDTVRRSWQWAVGLPLEVGAVSHPRPGVVEARDVTVRSSEGRRLATVATVEVEAAATEDRIRIEAVRLDAGAAAAVGELAREWLRNDARHPRNCLIEVATVAWSGTTAEPLPIRIECVGRDAARAIRVVRGSGDEIRVVRAVDGDAHEATERFEVEAHVGEPLSAAVAAGIAGWGEAASTVLAGARITGDLQGTFDATGAAGAVAGRIVGLNLAECCRAVKAGGAGDATITVRDVAWRSGRLTAASLEFESGPGWVDAAFFDRLVMALGCRPGPAAQGSADRRAFDVAAFALQVDGGAVLVRARDAAGMASSAAGVLVHEPGGPVAFDRLAWMVSPPAASFVPAAGPGAWLMSIVPGADGGGKTATNPTPDGGRRGF